MSINTMLGNCGTTYTGIIDTVNRRYRRTPWGPNCAAWLFISTLLAMSVVMAFPADAVSNSARACGSRVIYDYEAAIRTYRDGRRFPISGASPVGPKEVKIERSSTAVRVGGGRAGFAIQNSGFGPRTGLALRFELTLSRVGTRHGRSRTLRSAWRRIRRLGALEQVVLGLRTGRRPGIYRLDVSVVNEKIAREVRYTEYFRVLPRRTHFALKVFPSRVEQGSSVSFRLVNFGTVPVTIGRAFKVQQMLESDWVPVSALTPSGVPQDALTLGPGTMSSCARLAISGNLTPGRYRILKRVSLNAPGRSGRTRVAAGYFSVVG